MIQYKSHISHIWIRQSITYIKLVDKQTFFARKQKRSYHSSESKHSRGKSTGRDRDCFCLLCTFSFWSLLSEKFQFHLVIYDLCLPTSWHSVLRQEEYTRKLLGTACEDRYNIIYKWWMSIPSSFVVTSHLYIGIYKIHSQVCPFLKIRQTTQQKLNTITYFL